MCGFVFLRGRAITEESARAALAKLGHRGPDAESLRPVPGGGFVGFKRLAVMDLTSAGDQPFETSRSLIVCNGEIYNYRALKKEFPDFGFKSQSDCEVLLPLFEHGGIEEVVYKVDAEFALAALDKRTGKVYAARDPLGVRPLFYGRSTEGEICFASEAKALKEICADVAPFPPGCFYFDGKFKSFLDFAKTPDFHDDGMDDVLTNIRKKLVAGVEKRLQADAKVGFLLSGGLDSSLVCAIAQKKSAAPIKTFAIGMSEDAIDLKYAKEAADHIGSDHTEVIITREDVINHLREVVYHLETWDITTIRASMGMYLVCKHIKEQTDIKVLLTGEVSDEIFGYKYTDFAPSPEEFQKEAEKRAGELYMYDVLRADRCISAHSLEARVPFSDTDFVKYVMRTNPKLKMNSYGQGKYLLRKAFEGDYLPKSILYREKAAFSDAVGHSLVDHIKAYAEEVYCEKELAAAGVKHPYRTPFTKESLLYRDIFEEFYPGKAALIEDFWMPNKTWENCDVDDPSARALPNYGASGA